MFRPFRGNADRKTPHILWETSSESSAGSSIRARLASLRSSQPGHLVYRSGDSASGNSSMATPSDLSTPHSLATPSSQHLSTPSTLTTPGPSTLTTPNGPLLTPGDGAAHHAPGQLHTPEYVCLPAPGKCQPLPVVAESPLSQSEVPAFHVDTAEDTPHPPASAAPDDAGGGGEACAAAKDGSAKKARKRPSKNVRTQTKQIVNLLEVVEDPNQKITMAQELSAVNPYFRDVIAGKYGGDMTMASGSNEDASAQPRKAVEEILPI